MWEGPSGPGLGQVPSCWLRAACASAMGPSLSANVWVGDLGTPTHSSVFVESRSQPQLHARVPSSGHAPAK